MYGSKYRFQGNKRKKHVSVLYLRNVSLRQRISLKKDLNYLIIPNKYESKTATDQEVLGYLRAHYKDHVMESIIRKCEDINIASKDRKPIAAFCKRNSVKYEGGIKNKLSPRRQFRDVYMQLCKDFHKCLV